MFEYSYVKTLDKSRLKETALKYPGLCLWLPDEMKKGIKNDTMEIGRFGRYECA